MALTDFFNHNETPYRRQLKEFYRELDETNIPYEFGIENRRLFFRKARTRFIGICRLKRNPPITDVLIFLGISHQSLSDLEKGLLILSDREFYILVTFLGCSKEIPVFIEKLGKAMIPGLREEERKITK
jgi:hypothetical protein